jgi:arabinofuranan 3-O-arabinosyltransferase
VCDPVPPLSAGPHRLTAPDTDVWRVQSVSWQPANWSTAITAPRRDADVAAWSATHRTLRVTAGAATLLAVAENANAGWHATLGGRTLTPVRLDGWRQGWLVPAGAAGTVVLDYAPQRAYAAGLIGGAVAVFLLLLAALLPMRRRPAPSRLDPAGVTRTWIVLAGAAPVLIGGAWGLGALLAGMGAVGACAVFARFTGRRVQTAELLHGALGIALVAFVVAGTGPLQGWLPWAPFGGLPTQVAGLVAVALVVVVGVLRRPGAAQAVRDDDAGTAPSP